MTPTTWPAGQTTTVTITGTNLCNAADYITVPTGNVTQSEYYSLQTNTELQFTVMPDASDPNETATLEVGLNDGGSFWSWVPVTAQIVNKCTPTIASITPSTWFAGKTYDSVVIKGTGFITTDKATAACPVTTVTITAADGNAVSVSSVSVDSKEKITLTGVAPPASDPDESATVTVGSASNSATTTAEIEALAATITETGNIKNGIITVKAVAPSGTSGGLNLDLNGENDTYSQDFSSLSPGSHKLDFDLTAVPPDTYSTADGTWDANLPGGSGEQSVNVPSVTFAKEWIYLGLTRFSQYNTPYESQCSGGTQQMYVFDRSSCTYISGQLNSQFVSKTQLNGTGMSINYGLLKPLGSTNAGKLCKGKLPAGASSLNTFVQVSTVTGSCNTAITANHSVATWPNPNGKEEPPALLLCKDSLNLDNSDNTTAYTRVVADKCPACIDGGHIDSYTDNQACDAHGAIGDLGNYYTSTTR